MVPYREVLTLCLCHNSDKLQPDAHTSKQGKPMLRYNQNDILFEPILTSITRSFHELKSKNLYRDLPDLFTTNLVISAYFLLKLSRMRVSHACLIYCRYVKWIVSALGYQNSSHAGYQRQSQNCNEAIKQKGGRQAMVFWICVLFGVSYLVCNQPQ